MWSFLYLFSIVVVNWLFSFVPSLGEWNPISLLVGFTFIFRDMAQRQIGHRVSLVMLLGGVLSYLMADPFVAIASMSAFLTSEGIDWMVFTWTRKPLHDRILYSSALSTPFDSAVFSAMVGMLTPMNVLVMTSSKMFSAVVIYAAMHLALKRANPAGKEGSRPGDCLFGA